MQDFIKPLDIPSDGKPETFLMVGHRNEKQYTYINMVFFCRMTVKSPTPIPSPTDEFVNYKQMMYAIRSHISLCTVPTSIFGNICKELCLGIPSHKSRGKIGLLGTERKNTEFYGLRLMTCKSYAGKRLGYGIYGKETENFRQEKRGNKFLGIPCSS